MKRKLATYERGPEIKRKSEHRHVEKKAFQAPRTVSTKVVKKITPKPQASKMSTQKSTKGAALQKKTAEKQVVETPSVDPIPGGHYELSPLMSKMLDAELQDVMVKVCQALPEHATSEAEKLVANKYRNRAGDALRNVIGLNVTERLLNVHNTLYVKISFSGKPLRSDLISFLKKYNITSFKRVGAGTFAARMQNFQDFDDICAEKDLKCGARIRVTVLPCVQFLACPSNLRTCYDGKSDVTNKNDDKSPVKSKPAQNNDKENSAKEIKVKTETTEDDKPVENNTKSVGLTPAPTKQNVAPKATPTKTNQSVTKAQANQAKSDTKADPPTPKSNAPVSESKEAPAKPTPVKSNEAQKAPSKPNQTATTTNNQNATQKPNAKENTTNVKPAVVTPMKSNAGTVKQTPVKAQTINQNEKAANTASNKSGETQNASKAAPAKLTVNQKVVAKTTPGKPVAANRTPKAAAKTNQTAKPAPKVTPKPAAKGAKLVKSPTKPLAKKKGESDFDELSDHDILAMISEGIVLDECSGSEED